MESISIFLFFILARSFWEEWGEHRDGHGGFMMMRYEVVGGSIGKAWTYIWGFVLCLFSMRWGILIALGKIARLIDRFYDVCSL